MTPFTLYRFRTVLVLFLILKVKRQKINHVEQYENVMKSAQCKQGLYYAINNCFSILSVRRGLFQSWMGHIAVTLRKTEVSYDLVKQSWLYAVWGFKNEAQNMFFNLGTSQSVRYISLEPFILHTWCNYTRVWITIGRVTLLHYYKCFN